jgi:hypothetical protein
MLGLLAGLARRLADHEGAVANARSAATELSRCRLERAEVDLYLAALAEGRTPAVAIRLGNGETISMA